jgi:hypothetical protein
MNAVAALLGFLVLKPMIRSRLKRPSELSVLPQASREPGMRSAA